MSIRIEIIDPTIKDEKMLVATARFLMEIAGHQMVPAPSIPTATTEDIVRINGEIEKSVIIPGNYQIGDSIPESILEKYIKKPVLTETLEVFDEVHKVKVNKTKEEVESILNKPKRKKKEESLKVAEASPFVPEVAPPYAHCAAPIPPVSLMNFNTFMTKVTALRREEKIQEIDLLNIVRKHGIDKTHMLSTNPDLVPLVNADLDKLLEGK